VADWEGIKVQNASVSKTTRTIETEDILNAKDRYHARRSAHAQTTGGASG
jgi:hypothetical protein